MHKDLVLGIDVGTGSVRAALVTLDGGLEALASAPLSVDYPRPGWAEQSLPDAWTAVVTAVRAVLARVPASAERVLALGLDGATVSLAAVSEAGEPIGPAIAWMDTRAHRQAQRITDTGHPLLRYCGGQASTEGLLAKALWLKECAPDVYRTADRVVDSVDWYVHRLTGRWATSACTALCEANLDPASVRWDPRLLADLGLEDLEERSALPPLAPGEVVGPLRAAAAAELGLRPGLPVVQVAGDTYAATIGVGALASGQLALVLGSSACYVANAESAHCTEGLVTCVPGALVPGTWLVSSGQTSAGSVARWFLRAFAPDDDERHAFERWERRAEVVPPGAEGLLVADYWQGSRSPLRDPLARGVAVGLSLAHEPAHLFRAILEGVAFGGRHAVEALISAGLSPTEVRVCGGGSRSRLWMRIHADALGLPLRIPEIAEASALGSAICAAVGAGAYPSLPAAAARMVRLAETVEPDRASSQAYEFFYQRYLEIYPALRETLHELASRPTGETERVTA